MSAGLRVPTRRSRRRRSDFPSSGDTAQDVGPRNSTRDTGVGKPPRQLAVDTRKAAAPSRTDKKLRRGRREPCDPGVLPSSGTGRLSCPPRGWLFSAVLSADLGSHRETIPSNTGPEHTTGRLGPGRIPASGVPSVSLSWARRFPRLACPLSPCPSWEGPGPPARPSGAATTCHCHGLLGSPRPRRGGAGLGS